jgi:prepilin-type N-terminal cleavage/methylation domain-containing protein
MNQKNTTDKGFTLIELLVVISIISLLSSVILASVKQARIKALNSTLGQEVAEYERALDTYYLDNGYYPLAPTYGGGSCLDHDGCFYGAGHLDPVLNASINPYFPNHPQVVDTTGVGLFYNVVTNNAANTGYTKIYLLWNETNVQKCGARGYYNPSGNPTTCFVYLPDYSSN